uniref:KASH domain-containing protein n=1 Tax=Macrostomum lignano TaxID=282301 RepID=A0A1I8JBJ0_9PLAT
RLRQRQPLERRRRLRRGLVGDFAAGRQLPDPPCPRPGPHRRAAGSVGSSFGSGTGRYRGGTSGGRWRDFRSDTRLYWECLAGGSEAYSEGDGSGSAGVDGGDGGRIGRRGRDATSSDVDESWSFSRSDLSSSAGSYGLELPDNRGGAVESGARISCDSLEGGMHPHPGGSAAQEAVSSDHSLLLVDRADRHLYWQHRSDLHPEAAATAFDSTDGAATASNMPTVGEEDQSGLDESSLSSVANEQLDVDQLWDYSCQPDLYSDADDTDELDEQRTQAALLLEDSQLSLWEIDQPAMDLTSAGLLPPQLPASAVRRRKIAAELLETEHDFLFDASAADMAAGVERLDRLADDLRRWLATGAAELEELRQAEGESRQRRLLMENWELLIGWLQSDLDSCQSNRESLSRAHASMLELERLLCRCERLIQEELHRLRQLESASSFDRETAAADL